MLRLLGPSLFVLASLTTPLASAQESPTDEEARSLFEAGRTAYAGGRYDAALDYFERSYELSGRPELLYNIASAHDRLRHDPEALEAFRRYLAALPNAENATVVEARIALLEDAVATHRADAGETEGEVAPPLAADGDGGGSVVEAWWFWTLIGVVVVGAGVGIGVGVAVSSDTVEGPLPGSTGQVVTALVSF